MRYHYWLNQLLLIFDSSVIAEKSVDASCPRIAYANATLVTS